MSVKEHVGIFGEGRAGGKGGQHLPQLLGWEGRSDLSISGEGSQQISTPSTGTR